MNVIITGTQGYVATRLKEALDRDGGFQTELLSLRGDDWKNGSLSRADALVHAAALVHESEKRFGQEAYDRINRDLTLELARRAKAQGVGRFLYISTLAVYGVQQSLDKKCQIGPDTVPHPVTFYGKSKLAAEEGLRALGDERFRVAVVRPPMLYGPGCPGNYAKLRDACLKIRCVPKFDNEKSLLFIDHFTEYLRRALIEKKEGRLFPQNRERVSTWRLAEEIGRANGVSVRATRLLNPVARLAALAIPKINVAFGSIAYEKNMSADFDFDYSYLPFEETIRLTEEKRA